MLPAHQESFQIKKNCYENFFDGRLICGFQTKENDHLQNNNFANKLKIINEKIYSLKKESHYHTNINIFDYNLEEKTLEQKDFEKIHKYNNSNEEDLCNGSDVKWYISQDDFFNFYPRIQFVACFKILNNDNPKTAHLEQVSVNPIVRLNKIGEMGLFDSFAHIFNLSLEIQTIALSYYEDFLKKYYEKFGFLNIDDENMILDKKNFINILVNKKNIIIEKEEHVKQLVYFLNTNKIIFNRKIK